MQFTPEELAPGYTPKEIENLFFLRKDLSGLSKKDMECLLVKVNRLGLKDIRLDSVQFLLFMMHEAREVDQNRFLNEVFLPWHGLRHKTKPHFERICEELRRIGEFEPGSIQEAEHSVNIYRNLVSDLFDPYLTLAVASFQFKERKFTKLEDADVGQGERNKFEYLNSKWKGICKGDARFLAGYDPVVRNAVSHAGAHGVTYRSDSLVFKNIKRGTPATVETVIWSFDELQYRVMQLLECIQSIEVAAEIFGLDCSDAIISEVDTYCQFVLHACSPERRSELRERHEQAIAKIRANEQLPQKQKLEALSQALFYNCRLRSMPCHGVRFSSSESLVVVDVPSVAIDLTNDDQIRARVLELPRYAILARSVFGDMYDTVFVVETDETRKNDQIAVQLSGKDLDEYIEERAGLLDLLNDSKWTLRGDAFGIQIDFNAVEQAEKASVNEPFPRKVRQFP